MNRVMVEEWNKVVLPTDLVYHLGDVAMWKIAQLEVVQQLNGEKILIGGNHDTFHASIFLGSGFADVKALKELQRDKKQILLSHLPVHPMEMKPHGRWDLNIHGHIHNSTVPNPLLWDMTLIEKEEFAMQGGKTYDPRYVCVSVEQTDYKPVLLDSVVHERFRYGH